MPNSIRVFENSLRNYLIDAQADSYNTVSKIQYRYNNLKVYMEPDKLRTPHFWVSVGISEACYGIDPLEKLKGSLAQDDRYILMWGSRPNINGELKKQWIILSKKNSNVFTPGKDDDDEGGPKNQPKGPEKDKKEEETKNNEPQKQTVRAADETPDYISGTGISRSRLKNQIKKEEETKENKDKNN